MRRPWLLLTLALLSLSCVGASALAQGDEPFVTVIGPDAQGVHLDVQQVAAGVCVRLAGTGAAQEDQVCGDFARIDLYEPFLLDTSLSARRGPIHVGGAVRAGVARVEYGLADGRSVGADTVATPQIGGRAGTELRFFLLTLPAGSDPVTRRLLDAAGTVVSESDELAGIGSGAGPRPLRGPVRLARGHSSGARWALYGSLRSVLEPVRGDAGRRVPRVCLATRRSVRESSGCEDDAVSTFSYDVAPGCAGRQATLLLGFAASGVRVEARLGDGRWRTARMLGLPAGYAQAGERAWVFAIPADAALRSIRGIAAGGRVVAKEDIGLPPPRLRCERGSPELFDVLDDLSETPPPLTGPATELRPSGGPPLFVGEAGAELCVALEPAAGDRDCELPTPALAIPQLVLSGDGRTLGGAVDPAIAAVEVRSRDGSRQRVTTDAGAAYTGRYAGRVRFFTVAGPPAGVESFALLDAAGKRVTGDTLQFDIKRIGRSRVVLRERTAGGRFDVRQASFSVPFLSRRPLRCLAITRPGRSLDNPFNCLALTERGDHLPASLLNGIVRCDLHAAILIGAASSRAGAVRARLDDGSTRAGRLFRSSLGRSFLVVPPPDRGLRRVEVLDRAGKPLTTYSARLPPARSQCGYGFSLLEGSAATTSTPKPGVSGMTALRSKHAPFTDPRLARPRRRP